MFYAAVLKLKFTWIVNKFYIKSYCTKQNWIFVLNCTPLLLHHVCVDILVSDIFIICCLFLPIYFSLRNKKKVSAFLCKSILLWKTAILLSFVFIGVAPLAYKIFAKNSYSENLNSIRLCLVMFFFWIQMKLSARFTCLPFCAHTDCDNKIAIFGALVAKNGIFLVIW